MKKHIINSLLSASLALSIITGLSLQIPFTSYAAHSHTWKKTTSRSISGIFEYKKWIVDSEADIEYDTSYERRGLECADCGRFFESYYGEDGWRAWAMKNSSIGHSEHGAYLTNWIPVAEDVRFIDEDGHFKTFTQKVSGTETSYRCTCGKRKSTHKHIWKPVYGFKDTKYTEEVWVPEYLPWNETHWDSRVWIECLGCSRTFSSEAEWQLHQANTIKAGSPHLASTTCSERTTATEVIAHPGTGHYETVTRTRKEAFVKCYVCPLCDKKKN